MCGIIAYFGQNTTIIEKVRNGFKLIKHRGPDFSEIIANNEGFIGFHRLSIIDLSSKGNQPLSNREEDLVLVCNGEIYNHSSLRSQLSYDFKSESDCEVILPLYQKYGLEETLKILDGEFAFVLFDRKKNLSFAARDPLGIRPLFYGYTSNNELIFSSEMKALHKVCDKIEPFLPGYFYDGKEFRCYRNPCHVEQYHSDSEECISKTINKLLTNAVEKRLHADVPIGYLLSGGLDSSLVCSIAQRAGKESIRTFAIGMKNDAIDLKYAKEVSQFLGTQHTEIIIDREDIIAALEKTIWHLESWDITTIRASIGMYLMCQFIRKNTDIKVLLTGEVSDELFGYKYTDFAPSAKAFQIESAKRVNELYMYDVLRADRCIAAHSLEARVPFSDYEFVKYVMHINPEKKLNHHGLGKYLLREAFSVGNYLPDSILYRDKAAFSDAVGHSLVDELKKYAQEKYQNKELSQLTDRYFRPKPLSYEALLYLEIFLKMYPQRENLIKDYWLPNKDWQNCNLTDPSARFLPNYGKSGE